MSDWSQGYVVSTDYIFSYCAELNPGRCQLPLLNAGFATPDIHVACELGFGQGLSTAIHAATAPVAWWATDFHPTQTAFARQLIATSGCSAHMYDQSFEEFCQRTDLPDFDFIGLHGVWSWIQPHNRQIIIDFIRRKLKVGGICYLSYNTQPGWAARLPFRHLLDEYAKVMVPPGESMIGRVEAAFDFGEKLVQLQPAFITANPRVAEQFHWIKQADPHYLAHEFFNQAWNSFSFTETAISLEPAKVTFAASANTLDHLDAYHLTEAQQRFLQDIPDPIFQQTVRDFMINQQFRQDYWIKGPRRLSPRERLVSLRQQRVILNISRDRVHEASFDIPGEIPLDPERFAVVLDALADYRPRTIAALEDELRNDGIDLNAILHAILALMSRNIIVQVQSPEQIENARPHTERLNNFLINLAEDSDNIIHLASPVTGSAVILRRIPRLFLRALSLGHETPQAWAEWVWQRFALPNENRIKDAVPLPVHESLGNLMAQAHQFSTQLPRLRALGVL